MSLPPFRNEPYTDFSIPANRAAMESALTRIRTQLGRHYSLLIAGERVETPDKLISVNPARPDEIIGIHSKATRDLANRAVEAAYAAFPQ